MSTLIKKMGQLEESVKWADCESCFAVPGASSMIDLVHPITEKTVVYGLTLEEVRQRKGDEKAVLMTVEEFCKSKAERQDVPIEWVETTEEKFYYALNVLPPATMANGGFLIGEPWDHHALTGRPRYSGYREFDGRYFVSNRAMTREEFRKQMDG